MPDMVTITVNGRPVQVRKGITLSAALQNMMVDPFRRDTEGVPRGPLCGMGVCYECIATINGKMNQRTCQLMVREGLDVVLD